MAKEYNVKEFADKEYLSYSVYKLIQQMPSFHDTLSQTARKELYVLSKIPNKKIKTAEIYSLVYNQTNYLHGDKSTYNVFETLAADYKNNINLIEPKGSFGYRTNQAASSPRYTSGKFSDIAKLIFPKIDENIYEEQYLEGKKIEPLYLMPIIPLSIINGFNGIAVGYSASILPRDPNFIIDLLIGILERKIKKIPKYIPVKFPYYNGKIERGENDKQFIFYGNLEKSKSTKRYGTIIINEVPPGYDREKMVNIISELEDKNIVVDWSDNCVKNSFYFEIKVPIEIYEKSEEELLKLFKLITKDSETLTFLKYSYENKTILEYDTLAEYLKDWIIERLTLYHKRKLFILDQIKYDIIITENKIKFLEKIFKKEIIIEKRKKSNIENQLKKFDFYKINDKYDYLLSMPLWSLTTEKIQEFNEKIKELKQKYQEVEKQDPREIWLDELRHLRQVFLKLPKK